MPSYLHPGVYVEEIPSGSKPIEAVGTSTACFIGYAVRGPNNNEASVDAGELEPVLISKWDAYDSEFGGVRDTGATETPGDLDQMGHSVYAFFRNGGIKAYIIRVAADDPSGSLVASSGGLANAGSPPANLLTFTAVNEGQWGDELVVHVVGKPGQTTSAAESDADFVASKEFTIAIGSGKGDDFSALEVFTNVSMDSESDAYIVHKINDGSTLVDVEVGTGSDDQDFSDTLKRLFDDPAASPPGEADPYLEVGLGGGGDGSAGAASDYDAVFSALTKYRDVNIICMPGLFYDSAGKSIIDAAVSHCETMKNRMVIVDPPPGTEFGNEKDIQDQGFPTSTYSALYFPWVKVVNQYYDADTRPGVPMSLLVQPSGFAAGMWAKIDGKRGVWKAPAGVETRLLGAAGFEYVVEDAEQDYINPMGVCAFRTLPNYGQVIWGTRTLATKADPEWRYIPVRRTAMFIEESIYNGIQWAVFEPNNHLLWASLRGNIGSFMNGLFRTGAFQGEKASDAYFVRCGLGDTMVQGDIDRGQVIVIVGFAPLKPAEFVIVRIQQKVGQD